MRPFRLVVMVAVMLGIVLLAAACGGGEDAPSVEAPSQQMTDPQADDGAQQAPAEDSQGQTEAPPDDPAAGEAADPEADGGPDIDLEPSGVGDQDEEFRAQPESEEEAAALAIVPEPDVLGPAFELASPDSWTNDIEATSEGAFAAFDLKAAGWQGTFGRAYRNNGFLNDLAQAQFAQDGGSATLTAFLSLAAFDNEEGAAGAIRFFESVDPETLGLQVRGDSDVVIEPEPLEVEIGDISTGIVMPAELGAGFEGVELPSTVSVVGFQQGRYGAVLIVWTFGEPDLDLIQRIGHQIATSIESG